MAFSPRSSNRRDDQKAALVYDGPKSFEHIGHDDEIRNPVSSSSVIKTTLFAVSDGRIMTAPATDTTCPFASADSLRRQNALLRHLFAAKDIG